MTQDAAKIMKREGIAGSIVNVLSVVAYCGLEILAPYSSTKGALATFTKNVANGLRKHRIRVNGINLGWTDTPAEHVVQVSQGSPENWLEIAEKESHFGQLVKPDDDVPLPCPLSALRLKPYNPETLFPFLEEMELRTPRSRIEKTGL